MKHNFMTKMVSALLAVVLSTAAFSITAFASGGDYPDDALPAAESIAADTQETKQIGTVTTNGGNLNVRTGAGLDNTAFTQLPNGTVVDVIGRDGDWVKILLPARVGYVYGGYLTVTDAADSITTLGAFRTFTNIPGPGIKTAYFAALGAWSGVLPKNAESLRDSDALMRVAVPRRRGPAGLRCPVAAARSA